MQLMALPGIGGRARPGALAHPVVPPRDRILRRHALVDDVGDQLIVRRARRRVLVQLPLQVQRAQVHAQRSGNWVPVTADEPGWNSGWAGFRVGFRTCGCGWLLQG